MKHNLICIIGTPERRRRARDRKLFEKVMMENFPDLMREKVTQIQETHRVPNQRNAKKTSSRHIIIKMSKFQSKENLKGSKGEKRSNKQWRPSKTSS